MALSYDYNSDPRIVYGFSTDEKPTRPDAGTIFIETDTGNRFVYNGESWGKYTQPTKFGDIANLENSVGFSELSTSLFRSEIGNHIGTNGKAAFAIRFDDDPDMFKSKVLPLISARGIPCSLALVSRYAEVWGSTTTWAEIETWNKNYGVEIWSHSATHTDPNPRGDNGLIEEIVTSKLEIESHNVECVGWVYPGVTQLGSTTPYGSNFSSLNNFKSYAGYLIMQTYPISDAYIGQVYRNIPNGLTHGMSHYTLDGVTLATAKSVIDQAIKAKNGIKMMMHSKSIDVAGNMTSAEFGEFLDYVKLKYNSNVLDILTPSGLTFADKDRASRVSLLLDGSFEGLSIGSVGSWDSSTGWTAFKTIETTGGVDGGQYLKIATGESASSMIKQGMLNAKNYKGKSFFLKASIKTDGATTIYPRFIVSENGNLANKMVDFGSVSGSYPRVGVNNTEGWKVITIPFTIPKDILNPSILLQVGSYGGGNLFIDDIKIEKI